MTPEVQAEALALAEKLGVTLSDIGARAFALEVQYQMAYAWVSLAWAGLLAGLVVAACLFVRRYLREIAEDNFDPEGYTIGVILGGVAALILAIGACVTATDAILRFAAPQACAMHAFIEKAN